MIKICVRCNQRFNALDIKAVLCPVCIAYGQGYLEAGEETKKAQKELSELHIQIDKLAGVMETVWEIPRCEGDGNPITNAIVLLTKLRKKIPDVKNEERHDDR